jgi:hypothetical protein
MPAKDHGVNAVIPSARVQKRYMAPLLDLQQLTGSDERHRGPSISSASLRGRRTQ